MEKFWAGFQHCAAEVAQFLNKYDQEVSGELIQHISNYVPNVRVAPTPPTSAPPNNRLVNNFIAPRAFLSRELTAYNQRIYHKKMPDKCMSSINLTNKTKEFERELKMEVVEESNNVWRPW